MAYAILRTEKLKTFAKLKAVGGHHFRIHDVKNANPVKTSSNIELIGCDQRLVEAVQKRISHRKIRKNGVIAIEVLVTASPDFFRDNSSDYGVYDHAKTVEFNARALAFLKAEFGEQNVISAICHLDEATPHIQAIIVPIDPDSDRLNASRWLDGKERLSGLQDRFFDRVKSLGLERGLKGSASAHTTIQQFYGAIESAEMLSAPFPSVITPPLSIKESQRISWASEESERIHLQQKPHFSAIEAKAAVSSINRQKAQQAEKTAKKLAAELDLLKRDAKKARDIALRDVLTTMGASTVQKDKVYEVKGERISLDGQTFFNHHQTIGGGSAIDLVMHLEHLNYTEAISWLGGKLGTANAIGAAIAKAKIDAEGAVQQLVPLPIPELQSWLTVKHYLVNSRGLDERIVDWLYEKKQVFASTIRNRIMACFVYRKNAGLVGIELAGTGQLPFKGFRGDKSGSFKIKAKCPEGVVFVESAIDAVSFHMLKTKPQFLVYAPFDVIAVPGVEIQNAVALAKDYSRVVIGFNRDANYRGDAAFEQIRLWVPRAERLVPGHGYKEWNDYLRPDLINTSSLIPTDYALRTGNQLQTEH